MGVRIATIGVPFFMDGGLEVGKGWREVAELDDRQRTALRVHHGRLIQVHPDDRAKLRELGLDFDAPNKPLLDAKGPKPDANLKPDAGGKTDAKKSDATRAGK